MKKFKIECSIGERFFNDDNPLGPLLEIFTYIEDNKTCIYFSKTCKNLWNLYNYMLLKSSPTKYRLMFLNNSKYISSISSKDVVQCDDSIDLYKYKINFKQRFNFDKYTYCTDFEKSQKSGFSGSKFKEYDKYCSTFEEYEKTNEKCGITQLLQASIIDIVKELNNEENRDVFMISGSYALKLFTKKKFFTFDTGQIKKCIPPVIVRDKEKGPVDLDIFLLGPNKKRMCKELLKRFIVIYNTKLKKMLKDIDTRFSHISIRKSRGLISLYYGIKFKGCYCRSFHVKQGNNRGKSECYDLGCCRNKNCKVCRDTKFLDLIIKKNALLPRDIFEFFDLDCCKIGYFPGKYVKVTKQFIRSIITKKNYFPIRLNYKLLGLIDKEFQDTDFENTSYENIKYVDKQNVHIKRMKKYFSRLNIITIPDFPHQLEYYHHIKFDMILYLTLSNLMSEYMKYNKSRQYLKPSVRYKIRNHIKYSYYDCLNDDFIHKSYFETLILDDEVLNKIDICDNEINKYYYKIFGIKRRGKHGKYLYVERENRKDFSDVCMEI